MKTILGIFTILLSMVSFTLGANTEAGRAIIIYQNRGVDKLEFCKSNRRDIIKQYKGIKLKSGTTGVRNCWSDEKPIKDWEVLYHDSEGLSFSFGCNDLLSEFTISNINCEFDNGIKIGKSTKAEVINAFHIHQSVVNSFVELYIKIENENFETEFEFSDNHVLEEVTVRKIK